MRRPLALGFALASALPLLLSSDRPSSRHRLTGERYAQRIEALKRTDKIVCEEFENPDSSRVILCRENRVLVSVEERPPLERYEPKLPALDSFNEIAYRSGPQVYFSIVNPGEIRLFYEALLRASFIEPDTPPELTYYLPDGTLTHETTLDETPTEWTNFCDLGLVFLSTGKPVYAISGHPGDLQYELRGSDEPDIHNEALKRLILRYSKHTEIAR